MEVNSYIEPSKARWIRYPGISDCESLGGAILWFDGTFNWLESTKFDIAILGVPETRNSQRTVMNDAPDVIRNWLYGMRAVSSGEQIADLGNVVGSSLNDRYFAVGELVEYLEHQGVVVLLLGGSQDFTVPVCSFMKKEQRNLRLSVIDAFADVDPGNEDFSEASFLNKIYADFGSANIDELALLGCQTYYCGEQQEKFLARHFARVARLKDLRGEKLTNVEVFLRQMDVISFDFSAIKGQPVLPGGVRMPNGFEEHEACRIWWYAGASDVLKVAGLFNMPSVVEDEAPLAAQLCWHFLEGRGARNADYPIRPIEDYEMKAVYIDEYDETLYFYHNAYNGRWWIKVPSVKADAIVPCTEEDYDMAMNKELPDLWWHHFIKNGGNSNI